MRFGNLFKISVGVNYCKINIDTRKNFSLYLTKFLNDVSNEDPNWGLNLRPLSTLRNCAGLSERQERLTRDVRSKNSLLLVGVRESTHYDDDSSHKTIRI